MQIFTVHKAARLGLSHMTGSLDGLGSAAAMLRGP